MNFFLQLPFLSFKNGIIDLNLLTSINMLHLSIKNVLKWVTTNVINKPDGRSLPRLLGENSQLTSQNIGSFLAKSTTLVMAGVIIFVNWLKASISTLFPSGALVMDAWPKSSGWWDEEEKNKTGVVIARNQLLSLNKNTSLTRAAY